MCSDDPRTAPAAALHPAEARPESERIAFLLQRDGREMTQSWVERTATIYRNALAEPRHYANGPAYRPLFERAVQEFEEWLAAARDPLHRPASN